MNNHFSLCKCRKKSAICWGGLLWSNTSTTLLVEALLFPLVYTNWRSPDMCCILSCNLFWKACFSDELLYNFQAWSLITSTAWWSSPTCSCSRRFHTTGSLRSSDVVRDSRSENYHWCTFKRATQIAESLNDIIWSMTQQFKVNGGKIYTLRWSYWC